MSPLTKLLMSDAGLALGLHDEVVPLPEGQKGKVEQYLFFRRLTREGRWSMPKPSTPTPSPKRHRQPSLQRMPASPRCPSPRPPEQAAAHPTPLHVFGASLLHALQSASCHAWPMWRPVQRP